tara:strand:- start:203 stop:382 length:180 start_codon:yes stop_codon:yes gene_type:complete
MLSVYVLSAQLPPPPPPPGGGGGGGGGGAAPIDPISGIMLLIGGAIGAKKYFYDKKTDA